ncbi:MAG: T9SS type A sorting domain-containing protein [Balneolales bacterium]|nr:T9SS type A sorting domain-containing protein [Balneolales bacterium]
MILHDDYLWIGTCGDGISKVNTVTGEQTSIKTTNGLSSNCVLSLSVGPSGRIFVGTSNGYSVIGEPMQPGGQAMTPLRPVSLEDDEMSMLPATVELLPNYPNPFNPTTTVPFTLHETGHVRITVYNAVGQDVQILANQVVTAGQHQVTFNASGLSSGMYIVQIVHESGQMHTRPVMLVK